MAGFLAADVRDHSLLASPANGEGRISCLPRNHVEMRESVVDPAGRVGLEGVDEVRSRHVCRQGDVQVNMIRCAPSGQEDGALPSCDDRQASVQTLLPRTRDPGPASVGAPHEVDAHPHEGVPHEATLTREPIGTDPSLATRVARLPERHSPARKGGANGERSLDYCITSSKTSYNACVHAVIPNPRARYSPEKNSPATIRNANE